MSIMVGVGRGARAGVLVKDAEVLEKFENVDTLAVDKTGTLTAGKPALIDCIALGDRSVDDLLAAAAGLEEMRVSFHDGSLRTEIKERLDGQN